MGGDVAAGVRALREGRARADLSSWTQVLVTGSDAGTFLGDLISGDVAGLEPGRAGRSLLLTPTGRVRADFTVARLDQGYLLVQDPGQPDRIDALLAPYTLSADVAFLDRAGSALTAVIATPSSVPETSYAPGALGAGFDVLDADPASAWARDLQPVSPAAMEAWRILEGKPRFGPDFGPESIPAEAGLDEAIDATKGCFVGQESVAKVRNLGHPPFVVLPVRAVHPLRPGSPVHLARREVGVVTSAVEDPDGAFAGLVRVRWDARSGPLETEGGRLEVRAAAG